MTNVIFESYLHNIHLESNLIFRPVFSPVTFVEPISVTDVSLRIYIRHVDEIHYVTTSQMQTRYSNSETNKDEKNQGAQERKSNLGHIREIERKSFGKRKSANPKLVREIN